MNRSLSLLALLSLSAFAQGVPDAGEAPPPPATGAATSTNKGSGTKKEKPVTPPEATKAPEKK